MFRENKPYDLSPYDHPDIYPGPRINSSFLFFQKQAHKIEEMDGVPFEKSFVHISNQDVFSKPVSLQEVLKERSIEDKVPVIGYGSNACLAQLRYKFSLRPKEDDFTICMRASIEDSDIVYGPFLAPYGAVPAVIAPVKGAKTEVWINFMDKKQLQLMNSTEKGYELREHDGGKVRLVNGEVFEKVYAYYVPNALSWKGQWIRFTDIPGESPLESFWQADILDEIKLALAKEATREEFIHLLRWDTTFKNKVMSYLARMSDEFDHPDFHSCEDVYSLGEMKRDF
ncbi:MULTISPECIES: hypothetical protein [Bacillus]|uniref:hypothetical protein n=1 Tax=Bacillus TaxID=1386 RepID=UPI000BB82435|nr:MULTISPECIES: hypothetical protein [Bacillus]